MKMYSNEAGRRAKRIPGDLEQLRGTIAAYENPDPRLGGTPEALPLLARLMTAYATGYVREYRELVGNTGAPAALRLAAREVLVEAEHLLALLHRLQADEHEAPLTRQA